MLVMTRYPHEKIRLRLPSGALIWIDIKEVHGSRVRLAIEAAVDIEIMREELLPAAEKMSAQNKASRPTTP